MKIKISTLLISLYTLLLMLLAFTWWPANLHLVGGDDIKYEYIDPSSKISSLLNGDKVMLSPSESYLTHEISGFPFYVILSSLHTIFPFLNTQQLIDSLVLAGGFLGFFWMTSVIPVVGQARGYVPLVVRFVAANVYVFSTFNIVTVWDHQLPVYIDIAVLPFVLGFVIRSATNYSLADCVVVALLIALSPAPYGSIPWLVPVVLCGMPLLIAFAFEQPKDLCYTFATILLVCVILLFPAFITMAEFRGYSSGMFASDQVKESIRGFIELNKNNSLIYPLALTPPQDFLLVKLSLYREMPGMFKGVIYSLAVTMVALFVTAVLIVWRPGNRGNRRIIIGVLLSWLLCVILYAGGGNGAFLSFLVEAMKEFPFLTMLRNNYDKFGMAISLFSSLMIFYALIYIYGSFNTRGSAIKGTCTEQ